ncbi:MAG: glycosyltransferase family 39 protein, partial [candidate division WOR-3 bacterium]
RNAILFILLVAAIPVAVAWLHPLLPDEASYWVWSRQMAAGYFDHPPMVAWLVRAGVLILGNTHIGVRLLFVSFCAATGLLTYLLIKELSDERQGLHGLLAGTGALLLGVGGLLAVPDVPLLFFWTLGLYAGIMALKRPAWWIIYGFALGGAMLSKYSGIFLLTVPLAYIFTQRRRFLASGFWWARLGLAVLIFLPNIIWNAGHNWVSYGYQLGHGLGKPWNPSGLLKYIIDAALVNSLLPFIFLIWGTIRATRKIREPSVLALMLSFVMPFVLFWIASARGPAEANWPAPAYISLVILGTIGLGESTRAWPWRASVGFGLAIVALVYVQAIYPFLPVKGDPTENARGWRELAACVQTAREAYPDMAIAAPRYQEAAELSFYLPGNPLVKVANPTGRPNQLTLAYPPDTGENFIFVGEPKGGSETNLILECGGMRHYNVYLAKGYLCRH